MSSLIFINVHDPSLDGLFLNEQLNENCSGKPTGKTDLKNY